MKRRTMIGVASAAAVSLAAGATAWAVGGVPKGRPAIMRRVVAAVIDDALDEAQVTPDQRAKIHAARDRVFAVVDQERQSHQGHHEALLQLFEADGVDPAQLEALRLEGEASRQRIVDAIRQAVVEAHGILTTAQRRTVADYVRQHHRGAGSAWGRHSGGFWGPRAADTL